MIGRRRCGSATVGIGRVLQSIRKTGDCCRTGLLLGQLLLRQFRLMLLLKLGIDLRGDLNFSVAPGSLYLSGLD